jgi:hypothetical protein
MKMARLPSSHPARMEVALDSYSICASTVRMVVSPCLGGDLFAAADSYYTGSRFRRATPLGCRQFGGAEGIRTPDLRRAKAALSQLSYGPGARPASSLAGRWASLESNQGPQSYQDCALAD